MSQIIDFRSYQNASRSPMLVLIDLQQQIISAFPHQMRLMNEMLMNCRTALYHARRIGTPVAFARSTDLSNPSRGGWIDGFLPTRSDIVLDRYKPSCYASAEFSDIVGASGGQFAIAGFAGQTACLSTAVDAFHRGHKVTFLSDASASHALGDFSSDETHRLIVELIGLYGSVSKTAQWIANERRAASRTMRH